jgi:hypothetical protein
VIAGGPVGSDSGSGQNGGCVIFCPPGEIPEIPTPGSGGSDNPPNDTPNETPNETPTDTTNDPSKSSTSYSSSSSSYQTGNPIMDDIVTYDPAAAQSVAAQILSEESLLACMTITTGLEFVGTTCGATSLSPTPTTATDVTTSTAPITTEPPPSPSQQNPPESPKKAPGPDTPPPPKQPSPSQQASVPSIDGVPLEYFGPKTGKCSTGTQADFNAQAAKECLASLRSPDWINMPCAAMQGSCSGHIDACNGVTVQSTGDLWQNARDCYDICVSCLAISMDNGWNNAECNIKVGLAKCHVNYNIRPSSTPSQPPPPPPAQTGPEYSGTMTGTCSNGTQADFDVQAAKDCLTSLRSHDWISMPCGAIEGIQSSCPGHIAACNGMTVMSSGTNWNDPQDCYDGCVSCLAVAMDRGWNMAECEDRKDLATCKIMYNRKPGS